MKFLLKFGIKTSIFGLITICAHAEDKRIYQTDSLGNIQYNKSPYTIQKDGRMIQTDPIGSKHHHKQQFQIKGNKTYPIDSPGNIQYNNPEFEIKSVIKQ